MSEDNIQKDEEKIEDESTSTSPDEASTAADEFSSANIVKDGTCTYKWICELPMLKSFFLLLEVWKVLGVAFSFVIAFVCLFEMVSGNGISGASETLNVILICFVVVLVLTIPAYLIVTHVNNGKYTVLFEMNDEGITHTQLKTDKAQALDALTVLVGRSTDNNTVTGSGLLSASNVSLTSKFKEVRVIRTSPEKNLITIRTKLIDNQIYTEPEDYEFVENFIIEHCPRAYVMKDKGERR